MTFWINYHHLLYFKTIAEEGSVSKAAKKLKLGQPTLSSQLKTFEENLGIILFERHHKKLVLTEQGRIALDYSKNIFKMGNEMFEVLHDRPRALLPTIHIGTLDSISKQITLQLVQEAYKFSKCHVTLSEGNLSELMGGLSQHRIDIVLSNYLPSGLSAKELFPKSISKQGVAFYASPKFKYLRKNFPTSLSNVPVIFPTYDSKLRYDLEHWAKINKIQLNIIAEGQDIAIKKLMSINELGLIATASHTVTRQILLGELLEIGKLEGVYEELFLISANRKIENTIASYLLKNFSI